MFPLFYQDWLNPILGTVPGPSLFRGFVSSLVSLGISLAAVALGIVAIGRTTREARARGLKSPSPPMTVALAGLVLAGLSVLLVVGVSVMGFVLGLYSGELP